MRPLPNNNNNKKKKKKKKRKRLLCEGKCMSGALLLSHGKETSPVSTSVQGAMDSATACWGGADRVDAIVVVDLESGEHRGAILGFVCDI
jgi:hypothetical protein